MAPRKRLPEEERREVVTIRLPKKVIEKLKEKGKITEVVEKIVMEYLNDK